MKKLCRIGEFVKLSFHNSVTIFRSAFVPWLLKFQKAELRAPNYSLPDPLMMLDGMRVCDVRTWHERRRAEILELFRTHVYGRAPLWLFQTFHCLLSVDDHALAGIATRKELLITMGKKSDDLAMTLLLYLPNKVIKCGIKVPTFLGLNFYGNHTVHKDPGISISKSWIRNNSTTRGRPPETLRGIQSSSWPIEFILMHGYGLATVYYGDIVPDSNDGRELTMNKLFREKEPGPLETASWGAIDGWAWGLCRAMDYLERDPDIDANKIFVIGHSRLGKAALWAGATDERFAMVISCQSGCGGAALARRKFGETVAQINSLFPHWFCDAFKRYSNKEGSLPIDQHELISLIAPRPVYISSAQLDLPADPMGEFLAAKYASPVYRFLGTKGLPARDLPSVNMPVMGSIGYHIRKGRHGIILFDWAQYIAFANMHFKDRC